MSKLFLTMNSQAAWELRQVYLDHVINEKGPEMVVSNVCWRGLPGDGEGVAMITLEPATVLSFREPGDQRGLARTGSPATSKEIRLTFGSGYDRPLITVPPTGM